MLMDTFILLDTTGGSFLASLNGMLNVGDIIATVFMFILLLILLKKFAWGPLMKVMDERAEGIANDIDTAERNRKEAEELLAQQKAELKTASVEAQSIVEDARKRAEAQGAEIVAAARADIERMKEAAELEIKTEKERAVAALREEFVTISIDAASKVLEKEISEDDNRQLIEEAIVKAGEAK